VVEAIPLGALLAFSPSWMASFVDVCYSPTDTAPIHLCLLVIMSPPTVGAKAVIRPPVRLSVCPTSDGCTINRISNPDSRPTAIGAGTGLSFRGAIRCFSSKVIDQLLPMQLTIDMTCRAI